MPRYLDARSDVVFEKIFGRHSELLKSFLNAVLPLPQDCSIDSLTYLPIESDHKTERLISSVANVRCLDNHGCSFIVKIELQWSTAVVEWNYFNATKPRARKIEKEEVCRLLSPAYRLAIIDDTFKQDCELFHYYRMTNICNEGKSLEDIQLVLIELPKVSLTSITENRLAVLWIRFLKEINEKTETVDSSLLEVKEIKEALSLLEISSYSSAEYNAYERSWDAVSTLRTLLNGKFKEGFEKGKAKGKGEGKADAIRTGSNYMNR